MKYIILFCLFVNILIAEEQFEPLLQYTSNQIDEKISTISNQKFKARFYAFTDEIMCITCLQTLINSAKYINNIMDVEIILFLKSNNFSASSKIIVKKGWKYSIIDDKIGAYQNLYKVKKNPICFLTNNLGEIKFIGVPGSSDLFDAENFSEVSIKLSENDINSPDYRLELINEIRIQIDSNIIRNLSLVQIAKYNEYDKRFYFFSIQSQKLIITDSLGNVFKIRTFDNFFRPYFSFEGRFKKKILFVDIDQNYNLHFYTYNVETDSVSFFYTVFFSDSAFLFHPYLQYDDSIIITTSYINNMNINYNGKDLNLFQIHNINQKSSIFAGKFAQIYYNYPIHNFYHIGLSIDNDNNILIAQNFSDSLNYYNVDDFLLKSKIIRYDTNYYFSSWKETFNKLDNYSNIEEFKVLSDSVSNLAGTNCVLFDRITEIPALVYHKKEKFPSGKMNYVNYLNIVDSDFKYDYKFPYYNKPFYINNKIVYCIQHLENSLTINMFKLR